MTIDAERLVAAIDDYKAAYGVHANRLSYVLERDDARRGAEAAKGRQDAEPFGFGTATLGRGAKASGRNDCRARGGRGRGSPTSSPAGASWRSAGVTVTDKMRHRARDSWRNKGAVSSDGLA